MSPTVPFCLLIILVVGIQANKEGLLSESHDYSTTFRHNLSNKTAFPGKRPEPLHSNNLDYEDDEYDYFENEDGNKMFWKDVTKSNSLAYTVWYITDKHTGPIMKEEEFDKCLAEFKETKQAVGPLMVINSLTANENFLREIVNYGTTEDDLENDQLYYEKYSRVMTDHVSYLLAVRQIIQKIDDGLRQKLSCPSKISCGCLSSENVLKYEEEFARLSKYGSFLKIYLTFGFYIDPTIRLIIIMFGVVINILLLLIFAWHKNIRTESNVMILNIALNDVLVLIVYAPIQYVHHYYPNILPREYYTNNGIFVAIQTALISVSALSVLAMRFQLYFEVSRSLTTSPTSGFQIPSNWRSGLYVLAVWTSALFVAVLAYVNNNEKDVGHPFAALLYTVLYIFVLSLAMSVLNNLIVGRLKQISHKKHESKHITSSSTIVALSKAFGITHIPLFIWLLFDGYYGVILKVIHFGSYRHFGILIYYLNFLSACFYPLALYRTNGTYRTLFDRYLFSCW